MTALPSTIRLADPYPRGYVPPPRFEKERDHAETIRRVREVVRYSGLVPFFERRLKRTLGRPVAGLTVEGILVTILGTANERQPMLITEFVDFLYHRTSDCDRAAMGVTRKPPTVVEAHHPEWFKQRALVETENAESQFRKRLRAMLAPIDPSPHRPGKQLDRELFNVRELASSPAETAHRRMLLDWVCNRLLEATWLTLPKAVRRSWKGSLALDATFVGTWAQGRGTSNPKTSADPDAWWWRRDKDHHVPTTVGVDLKATDDNGKAMYKFGLDCELAIVGYDDPLLAQAYPFLVLGMTLHRPGFTPAKFATDVLSDIQNRHHLVDPETGLPLDTDPATGHRTGFAHPDGPDVQKHPAGWLAADRAYTSQKWDAYALPVRALGYRPLMDYLEIDYGLEGSHKGMILVEGTWYCPSMPKDLVEATRDRKVRKTIDDRLYRARIKAREPYEMRRRGTGADPHDTEWVCPAEGVVGTHKPPRNPCNRKPASLVLLNMPTTRHRLKMDPDLTAVAGEIPEVCRTHQVLAHNSTHVKLRQDLPYEGQDWRDKFHSLRSSVEGVNGTAKSDGVTGIDSPGNRRTMGLAATSLFTACMIAAENLRKIAAFYDKATWNDTDGTMTNHTPKKPRGCRRPAPWTRDWLPDRTTNIELVINGGVPHYAQAEPDRPPGDPPPETKRQKQTRDRRDGRAK